ncbi:hypothetical protein A2U01_0016565, partial [Trifolium medium]|nr:hypothetical protein [Trifolium medium]
VTVHLESGGGFPTAGLMGSGGYCSRASA